MSDRKYFLDFFEGYIDELKYPDALVDEINKWLELVYRLNKKFYEIGKTDIASSKKRSEFLGEIKSIYYCHKFLEGSNFIIEPKTEIEFIYEKDGENFFVEVKTPSWRGEIFKDSSLTQEEKIQRIQQVKYLNGEGRSFALKDAFAEPIKHALPKFKKGQKNILIVTPDMFVDLHASPDFLVEHVINKELEKQDPTGIITEVAVLETPVFLDTDEVTYQYSAYRRKKFNNSSANSA